MEANGTFRLEQVDRTMVVTPLINLGELEYERIEKDGKSVLDQLAEAHVENVIVDCRHTVYFGSAALGFFVRVWGRVRAQGGQMAFRNLSPEEHDILRISRLDTLWTVC